MDISERITHILTSAGLDPSHIKVDTSSPLGGTNTSYICVGPGTSEKYVLRLASNHSNTLRINRKGEFAALEISSKLGCGPKLLYFDADSGDMLTEFIEGRQLTPEDFIPENTAIFAAIMKQLHSGKTEHTFDPFKDVELKLESIRAHNIALDNRFSECYHFYRRIAEKYEDYIPDEFTGLCHNDPFAGNFIMRPSGDLALVDFEFAGTGNIFYDFSCLISSWTDKMRAGFYNSYFGHSDPEYDLILRDWDVINVMWNCTWAYLKSLDQTDACDGTAYNGDQSFDYIEFGHKHVEILESMRASRPE